MSKSWQNYWKNRTNYNKDYFGKDGSNADEIINALDIIGRDNVLDIGCGNGSFLIDIRGKKSANCFGIDLSPVAVRLNKDKKITLCVADMHSIPYNENYFTKIFSRGTVEHTPETRCVFHEINRVLKYDGKILITVPNKNSFFHITKKIKMLLGIWDPEVGYEKSFTIKEIRKLLEISGFKLQKVWVIPHMKVSNIFNWADNLLNKLDGNKFGFFIYFTAVKVRNLK